MKAEIVYEDNNIIICNKPAGMPSQSDRGFSQDLCGYVRTYLVRAGRQDEVHIINRLDRPVGGLVLFALNRQTAAALSAMSGEHSIEKNYLALVEGVTDDKGTLQNYLLKDAKENISRIVPDDTDGAKKAVLSYERIAECEVEGRKTSLVDVRLHTGRHHQIRVQFAGIGHPLVGDFKYNHGPVQKGMTPMLFAYRLAFNNPAGADRIQVEIRPKGGLWDDIKLER